MADLANPVIKPADVKLSDFSGGGDFAMQFGRIGSVLGLTRLACAMQVIPPGKKAFPHHVHHAADEMVFVLEGTGTYRWGEDRFAIGPGDLVGAPMAGRAHQIENTGDADLVCLAFSSNPDADVVEYPDSGKVACIAGMEAGDPNSGSIFAFGRLIQTDYWDGEV